MIDAKNGSIARSGKKRRVRILFAGERSVRSAPSRTLAAALEVCGFECRHGGDAFVSSTRWMKALGGVDVVVLVSYGYIEPFTMRQVAMAVAMGRPVVRWWVGTDVFECLEDERTAESVRALDGVVGTNVAVAQHLVEELWRIQIRAIHVPSVANLPSCEAGTRASALPKRLLIYLPSKRREFYGGRIVEKAVIANPDVTFVIVADDHHSLADHPNVQSIGWIEDMDSVWESVGGVLRVTRHDGLPRMVLEAMARGKYVMYSWPLAGCWLTRTFDEVQIGIERFKAAVEPNRAGQIAIKEMLQVDPSKTFASILRGSRCSVMRRARGISLFARCAAEEVLEKWAKT